MDRVVSAPTACARSHATSRRESIGRSLIGLTLANRFLRVAFRLMGLMTANATRCAIRATMRSVLLAVWILRETTGRLRRNYRVPRWEGRCSAGHQPSSYLCIVTSEVGPIYDSICPRTVTDVTQEEVMSCSAGTQRLGEKLPLPPPAALRCGDGQSNSDKKVRAAVSGGPHEPQGASRGANWRRRLGARSLVAPI